MQTEKQATPIPAVKWAYIHPNRHVITPQSSFTSYGPEATSICGRTMPGTLYRDHLAPDPDCTCGFYAWKRLNLTEGIDWQPRLIGSMLTGGKLVSRGYPVLLEVELYGRIIEHELGYRAQHQRVLAIHTWDFRAAMFRAMFPVDVVGHSREKLMSLRCLPEEGSPWYR